MNSRELDDVFRDVFRGSAAVSAGVLTRARLRGPEFQRLFRDVYVRASATVTHELRCRAASLALPAGAVVTGRSAATVHGVRVAWPEDPVQILAPPEMRLGRRTGLDVRRTVVEPDDAGPWAYGLMATPLRLALDLLLDRPVPDAVAGLAPVPQYVLEIGFQRSVRFDLAFPHRKVAVEYDGDWRDGELWALNRDRERLNQVRSLGWDVVFVTAPLLRDPRRLVRTVRQALGE